MPPGGLEPPTRCLGSSGSECLTDAGRDSHIDRSHECVHGCRTPGAPARAPLSTRGIQPATAWTTTIRVGCWPDRIRLSSAVSVALSAAHFLSAWTHEPAPEHRTGAQRAIAGFLSGIHVRVLPADRPSCSAASACPVDSAVVTLRPSQATRCPGLPVGPGGARSRTAVVVGFGPCGRRTGPWREWRACLTPRCCHYGLTWHHLGATLTPWIWRRMSRTSAASSR
jgi:hypothetical protein